MSDASLPQCTAVLMQRWQCLSGRVESPRAVSALWVCLTSTSGTMPRCPMWCGGGCLGDTPGKRAGGGSERYTG